MIKEKKRKAPLVGLTETAPACVSLLQLHSLNLLEKKRKLIAHLLLSTNEWSSNDWPLQRRNVNTTSNELIPSSELSELCTNHWQTEQIDTSADIFFWVQSFLVVMRIIPWTTNSWQKGFIWSSWAVTFLSFSPLIYIFYFLFPNCKLHAY